MVILTIFGLLLIALAPVLHMYYDGRFKSIVTSQLVLGLYFSVFIPALIYFKCRSNFNATNRFTERMAWTVDHEWINIKGDTFESKMTWDKIHRVLETKEVFLIYQSKLLAHILSKREMSQGQVQGFRSVVKGVLGLKHKLRED